MASMLLMHAGIAQAQAPYRLQADQARRRRRAEACCGGRAPTLLNPHFAVGTKDQEGSRIFYEPLAGWDPEGNLVPMLAAEIPIRENGGLAADGKSVTWKLKQGVSGTTASRSPPTTCVFNWEYASDPATAAVTIGIYKDVKVEKVDAHTVRVMFAKPTPFWADAFVGARRHDHPEAPVRGLHRRQVARRADQPEAGRHRALQVRRLQAGRHGARRDQPELPRAQPAATSTRSR